MNAAKTPPLLAADERMWTAKDVAAFLRCSQSWVYGRAESGEIPCLRIGGLLRFDPETVRKFSRGEIANTGRVIALANRKG
jgi:excisionase family DNA binding protein